VNLLEDSYRIDARTVTPKLVTLILELANHRMSLAKLCLLKCILDSATIRTGEMHSAG
jgi:hypothetical protein